MTEIWRPIRFFDGYFVSDQGSVLSKRYGRPLKKTVRKRDGYLVVSLCALGVHKQVSIHRLVVEAFIGTIPDGMTVNHISGDKKDNRASNLEIVSVAENVRHAHRIGLCTSRSGSGIGAKLKPTDIPVILKRIEKGDIGRRIAEDYGVHEATISAIKCGVSWLTFEVVK
jgi:hypothetical protein